MKCEVGSILDSTDFNTFSKNHYTKKCSINKFDTLNGKKKKISHCCWCGKSRKSVDYLTEENQTNEKSISELWNVNTLQDDRHLINMTEIDVFSFIISANTMVKHFKQTWQQFDQIFLAECWFYALVYCWFSWPWVSAHWQHLVCWLNYLVAWKLPAALPKRPLATE